LPLRVRAYSVLPLSENHTFSTGPVAGDASNKSAAEVPILRQLAFCAAAKPASASIKTVPPTVCLIVTL
jgi:hypothetical protein